MDSIYNDLNAPHSMGTTIIGVTYDGGVVLGADSRTSTGIFYLQTIFVTSYNFFLSSLSISYMDVFAGMYVANRASDKITQLTDNVYICRSGSVRASHVFFFRLFVWKLVLHI